MQEYWNIKIFLQKVTFQISQKCFWLKTLKTLSSGHMFLVILTENKLLERFMKKNCKNQIKKSLELKK